MSGSHTPQPNIKPYQIETSKLDHFIKCFKLINPEKYFRFPNEKELHLILKNQFSPMSHRFKQTLDSRQIDRFVECMIEIYNKVKINRVSIQNIYELRKII